MLHLFRGKYMKNKINIVCDLDDVLCNFVESWNIWLYENGHTSKILLNEDIHTYDYYIRRFDRKVLDFYQVENPYEDRVEPLDGALFFLEWCQEEFDNVTILSYASTEHNKKCKREFVKKHFGFDNIKFSDSKVEKFMFTKNSILVDDYPINLIQHTKNNLNPSILFNYNCKNTWANYYNHPDEIRELGQVLTSKCHIAENYEEVKDILTFIKENDKDENSSSVLW